MNRIAVTTSEAIVVIALPGSIAARDAPPPAIVLLVLLWVTWNLLERLSIKHEILFPSTLDRRSIFVYMGAIYIAQAVGAVQCGLTATTSVPFAGSVLGILVFVAGVLLRLRAIAELRRRFTYSLKTHGDLPLVTGGVYAWIRHPAYVGDAVILFAGSLILGSWWQVIAILAVFVPVLVVRVDKEEKVLLTEFGDAYRRYGTIANRFVPKITVRRPRPPSS